MALKVVVNPILEAYRRSLEDGSDYTIAQRAESERFRRLLPSLLRKLLRRAG